MNGEKFIRLCEKNFGKDIVDAGQNQPAVIPHDEKTASEIIKSANVEKCKIILAGGRTFPFPFNQKDSFILSSSGIRSVSDISPQDFTVTVNSGTKVSEAVKKAAQENLLIPLDPLSRDISTIGGAFMTGAEGPLAAGYGSFKRYVTGIRCVSPEGKIVEFGGKTAKNVTGYDGVNFMHSTMGLFGFVTALTIKAKALPGKRVFIKAIFGDFHKVLNVLNSETSLIENPVIFDITASKGLEAKPVIWLGYDGIGKIVDENAGRATDFLTNKGAEKIEIVEENIFYDERTAISSKMTGRDFYTFGMNPSSVKYFLLKVSDFQERLSLAAHPLTGKVHLKTDDNNVLRTLAAHLKIIGGKEPLEWEHYIHKGFSGLFNENEFKIAKALKKELDPNNIMNSDMGI